MRTATSTSSCTRALVLLYDGILWRNRSNEAGPVPRRPCSARASPDLGSHSTAAMMTACRPSGVLAASTRARTQSLSHSEAMPTHRSRPPAEFVSTASAADMNCAIDSWSVSNTSKAAVCLQCTVTDAALAAPRAASEL